MTGALGASRLRTDARQLAPETVTKKSMQHNVSMSDPPGKRWPGARRAADIRDPERREFVSKPRNESQHSWRSFYASPAAF